MRLDSAPSCALRIALGVALFAALFLFLGSSGAFASSDPSSPGTTSSGQVPAQGKGLLSGILSSVVDLVDKTVAQVPAVKDITANNTVTQVVAPVTAVTDRVESTVNAVPAVGQVLAPVRNATSTLVPPVVNIVGSVATPVLTTVDKATAPVVELVSPVIDPITGTLKPVVDGVGGVAVPVVDGVDTTTGPGASAGVGSASNNLGHYVGDTSSAGARHLGSVRAGNAPSQAGSLGSLAKYLAAGSNPGFPGSAGAAGALAVPASPSGSGVNASCNSDPNALAVGPCAPAVTSSPAPAAGSGSSAGGTGGPGGASAAQENFAGHFSIAVQGLTLRHADWPMPASMPSNPGSTPG
ncbi:hypothetical protein AAGW05_06310 [Arthrobacter sp. LAPM80]|uniref:hypothetical protein n=1 Tax=Arthrobacter sp. LAPM80 TaxID=3141788 RepID=UPI00398B6489